MGKSLPIQVHTSTCCGTARRSAMGDTRRGTRWEWPITKRRVCCFDESHCVTGELGCDSACDPARSEWRSTQSALERSIRDVADRSSSRIQIFGRCCEAGSEEHNDSPPKEGFLILSCDLVSKRDEVIEDYRSGFVVDIAADIFGIPSGFPHDCSCRV